MKKYVYQYKSCDNFTQRPTAVDLFCGCGAVTQGIKDAGFRILSAVDNNPVACKTYRENHPEVSLFEADIRHLQPEALVAKHSVVDLLIACAPCQPFSSQNKFRKKDERALLILESLRFIEQLKPTLVFYENVPGLAADSRGAILAELRQGLSALRYTLGSPIKVNAADYSVPQRRLRCVMFATKQNHPLPILPEPFTPEGLRDTVEKAIGNLSPLAAGERSFEDSMHFARKHSPLALLRLRHIPKNGGNRFSLPSELELPCHKGTKAYPDVYGRMRWEDVAPTLTTGCTDITRGRFAHPRDDRAISLREAARLQTFSDSYHFSGNASDVAEQIGNAVPVNFAYAIGLASIMALQKLSASQGDGNG